MIVKGHVVVVGCDGTDTSKAAVGYAALRAGRDGLVVLVHAPGAKESWDHIFDDVLAEIPAGTRHEAVLSGHAPARALVETARDYRASEIVVGARSVGLVRNGLGRVSARLLREADRPVTVVPPGFDPAFQMVA